MLAPMKFKDYVWPHNPRVYEIKFRQNVVSHAVPFGLYVMQNIGRGHRVLRGEGEFCGEDAYKEFQKLATVFYEQTPGTLVHPLWMTTSAYFVALEVMQEPQENYVRYSFEFWEDYDGYDSEIKPIAAVQEQKSENAAQRAQEKKFHTVKSGDTMGAIACAHGIALQRLIELNPQVKNINYIYPGDILRVG